MAGIIKVNSVQLGDSTADTNNFQLRTNGDGTSKLARGALGTLGDVLSVGSDGRVSLTVAANGTPTDVGTLVSNVSTNLAAGTGSSLVGYIGSGTGAVARTLLAKAQDLVNVKDYGAVPGGVVDNTAALQAALIASDTVYIAEANYRIASSFTVAPNKKLIFINAGSLLIPTGVILIINGLVEGNTKKLFNGPGFVIGIRQVCPSGLVLWETG